MRAFGITFFSLCIYCSHPVKKKSIFSPGPAENKVTLISAKEARPKASLIVIGLVTNASMADVGSGPYVDYLCTLKVKRVLRGHTRSSSLTAYATANKAEKYPSKAETWLFFFDAQFNFLTATPNTPQNRRDALGY